MTLVLIETFPHAFRAGICDGQSVCSAGKPAQSCNKDCRIEHRNPAFYYSILRIFDQGKPKDASPPLIPPLKRGWECVTPSVEGDRALDLHKHRHKQSGGVGFV